MDWATARAAARRRNFAKYDLAEAQAYDAREGLGRLTPDDQAAYRADLARVFEFRPGQRVLDAGAGTGTLCAILAQLPGLALTALEPAAAMLELLRAKPELAHVSAVAGTCDEPGDRDRFDAGSFDLVVSRQLTNGLFDPLLAFRHWQRWLVPGGSVIVIDGLYGRDGWQGHWAEEVDVLPLSTCQGLATVPYLLEAVGFRVGTVERMTAVNALPSTRTPRYMVTATS